MDRQGNFKMDWLQAANPPPAPIKVTHYLHPTKGWKKGDGHRYVQQSNRIPKGFKYSDGKIEMIPRDKRRKANKMLRQDKETTLAIMKGQVNHNI